jgi:hypothetical protein
MHEPGLPCALDRYLRETAIPAGLHRDPLAPAAPPTPALNPAAHTSDPIAGQPVAAADPIPAPVSGSRTFLQDQSQSAHPTPQSCPPPEQNEPIAASAQKEANAPATTMDDRATPNSTPPDHRIEANAGATPRSARAAFAPTLRDRGIEASAAGYLPDDEPAFSSVLPHHLDQPSSIPCDYWSSRWYDRRLCDRGPPRRRRRHPADENAAPQDPHPDQSG